MRIKSSTYWLVALLVILLAGTAWSLIGKRILPVAPSLTSAQQNRGKEKSPIGKDAVTAMYTVPEKDQNNKDFVADGNLTKVGQYTVDSNGLESKLVAQKNINKTVENGPIIYHVSEIVVVANNARTEGALRNARFMYNDENLDQRFKTMIIVYTIANGAGDSIKTSGIANLQFTNGTVSSKLSGLANDDDLNRLGLAEGETTKVSTASVIGNTDLKQKNFKIQFASVHSGTTDQDIAGPSKTFTITY